MDACYKAFSSPSPSQKKKSLSLSLSLSLSMHHALISITDLTFMYRSNWDVELDINLSDSLLEHSWLDEGM